MSLINEALKKAQRQRHDAPAPGAASPAGEAGAVGKRAEPRSAQTTLFIVAGAVLLVVVSIALTAFWLTRTPSTPTAAPTSRTVAAASKAAEPTAPNVTFTAPAPAPKPAAEGVKPAAAPKSVAVTPTPTAVVPAAPAPTETPSMAAAAPAEPTPAAPVAKAEPPPKPDERIQQFIDAIKVAGVRPSGADSKVLMNDRVYRLNDLVDRSLGLRLTKVTRESLTFTDAKGVVYVKDL